MKGLLFKGVPRMHRCIDRGWKYGSRHYGYVFANHSLLSFANLKTPFSSWLYAFCCLILICSLYTILDHSRSHPFNSDVLLKVEPRIWPY